jgi:hypothetical protein
VVGGDLDGRTYETGSGVDAWRFAGVAARGCRMQAAFVNRWIVVKVERSRRYRLLEQR